MKDLKILITNDDGIEADGIIRLAECAKKFGKVYVVAPESQKSACSHSITLRHPFTAKKFDFPISDVTAYAVDGTPGDCTRIGILNLVPGKPDVVFSGINCGYNCATDLQYSATVGAAMEAAFQGVPAIAFSEGFDRHETTDEYLERVMAELLEKTFSEDISLRQSLNYGQIWNVNFPDCSIADCKGISRDRKVSRDCVFYDHYDEEKLPDGSISFMVHGIPNDKSSEGTDLKALTDGYVSIGIANNIC